MVPDKLDLYEQHEIEQERLHKVRKNVRKKRALAEQEEEYGLLFEEVPQDYGTHRDLYYMED